MENTFRFFSNKECKYFPCHALPNEDEFNCLFCFCPLYSWGGKCGGNFRFSAAKGVKTCVDCHWPHMPEHYDAIVGKLSEALAGQEPEDGQGEGQAQDPEGLVDKDEDQAQADLE